MYPSFADNGDLFFFSTDSAGDADIYKSAYAGGNYSPAVRLPFNSNKFFDFDAVVDPQERFLIFTSNNRPGVGAGDLWITYRHGDNWSEPVNLGSKVNTKGNEGAPGLSRDGKTLYFRSYREVAGRPPATPSPEALTKLFHSPGNGLPQIYQVDISDLVN